MPQVHSINTTSKPEVDANGQYDLFETSPMVAAATRRPATRWHEFDDAVDNMGTLCMSNRLKHLAIAPVLLDELTTARDEWRWPSPLDTVDLLDVKGRPSQSR